ncbi:hypothetical protein FMUND_2834 [Fusarium mundagurra]|uniref:Uncharacterized protein n=1 Tax=Fusarium mundagurra TaxID=1567541 RepID=A0A8H6DLY1_9HYPO|nr:hypothetical protein FMUND_2834 [Fusarium mundagurra]
MPRDLRAQADNLEQWWKRDTMSAAQYNKHMRTQNWSDDYDISASQHRGEEGGASSVDDLFEQTCAEMEAEVEKAEKAETEMAESGETADSESPNHILACRSLAIADPARVIQLVQTYTHCYHAHYVSKSISKSSNKNMASTTRASIKRTRSTASLNDAAKILLRPPRCKPPTTLFSSVCTSLTSIMRNPIMSLTRSFPHAQNRKLLNYFPFNQSTNSVMASKKTNLKAGKAGKAGKPKSARNVSSETKVDGNSLRGARSPARVIVD